MNKIRRSKMTAIFLALIMVLSFISPTGPISETQAANLTHHEATYNSATGKATFTLHFDGSENNPSFAYLSGIDGNWSEYNKMYRLDWKDIGGGKWALTGDLILPTGNHQYKFRLHYGEGGPNSDDKWYPDTPPNLTITIPEKSITGDKYELVSSNNVLYSNDKIDLLVKKTDEKGNISFPEAVFSLDEASDEVNISENILSSQVINEAKTIKIKADLEGQSLEKNISLLVDENSYKNIHYYRFNHDYDKWNIWHWDDNNKGASFETQNESDFGKVFSINLSDSSHIILRKGDWDLQEKQFNTSVKKDYYFVEGHEVYTDFLAAMKAISPKIQVALMDKVNAITAYLSEEAKSTTKFSLYRNEVKVDNISYQVDGKKLTINLNSDFSFNANDLLEIKADNQFSSNIVTMRNVLDNFSYEGDDLGIKYIGDKISVKLWAPTAKNVSLVTYKNGDDQNSNHIDKIPMTYKPAEGLWQCEIPKEKTKETPFYLFNLDFYPDTDYGKSTYGVDPYAVSLGINGDKAAFIDLDSAETKPENWDSYLKPKLVNPEDSIIYEAHVRDFTIDPSSGVDENLRGKYLGFVQEGTKLPNTDIKTGIDHLKELGITHVHLLPTYDFASVDEKITDDPSNRNWGYDPKNYNAPEGSYTTDPRDPIKRVLEYRKMVQKMHKNDIRLVLDVVYNHMYKTDYMDAIVPGYFFRSNDYGNYTNGSGTGNEVASERKMVRKFIVDSVKHWTKDYKADGLRFDLMALIDIDTMKKVTSEVKKIDKTTIVYGEPWKAAYSPLDENLQTNHGKQKNNGFAIFNDSFRDSVRGNNDPKGGYVNGVFSEDITNKIKDGLKGSIETNTADPSEVINYVEVHDNYNLFDQIGTVNNADIKNGKFMEHLKRPDTNYMDEHIIKRINLAQALVYTSQGMPLTHSGTEFLRTKFGDHNSYKSNDDINKLDWSNKEAFKKVYEYQKGLIELRKEHPAFRMTDADSIRSGLGVWSAKHNSNIILAHLKNHANGDKWENILVIYNPTDSKYNFSNDGSDLPTPSESGEWTLVADGNSVDLNSTKKVPARPEVGPNSVTILYDREKEVKALTFDYLFSDRSIDYLEPMEPKINEDVKVRFRARAGEVEEAILHYYDKGEENKGDQTIPMTKITDDKFYVDRGYDKNKIEFFEGTIPGGEKEKYYNFEVKNSDKTAWISGGYNDGKSTNNGVSQEKPVFGDGIDYGFSLFYGYQSNKKIKESVIYQIMVDRFRNGDKSNDRSVLDPAVGKDPLKITAPSEIFEFKDEVVSGNETDKIWNNEFYNGDLTGVQQALPYLKDQLGIDTIYLSPIFQSNSYHKYDTEDYDFVDKNLGGNKVFSELTKSIHDENMSVIIDGVFNHTSSHHKWFKDFYNNKDTNTRYFKYDNPDGYYSWHGYNTLPKLNYGQDSLKKEIYENDNSIIKRYLKPPYNIDGWRMDAAEDLSATASLYKDKDKSQRESNLELWRIMSQAIRKTKKDAFILGEYWGPDNQWLDGKGWDGLMNYNAFYNPLIENNSKNYYKKHLKLSLDNQNGLSIADLGKQARMNEARNPHQAILNSTNSISSHDKPRFLDKDFTNSNPSGFMELAQALQLTYRGIPIIYYGDEIGMKSKNGSLGKDPYNRGPFNWDKSTWDEDAKTILNNYQKLIATRKANKNAFVYGAFEEIKSNNDQKYIAFARYGLDHKSIVVLNNNPNDGKQDIELKNLDRFGFKNGDELIDVLTGALYDIENNSINISSKNMGASVLVYKEKLGAFTTIDGPKLNEGIKDTRQALKAIDRAKYIEKGETIELKWDPIDEETKNKAHSILIRLYDDKNNVLKEIIVDKNTSTHTINTPDDVNLFKSAKNKKIRLIADRSLIENGVNDLYLDSEYKDIEKEIDKDALIEKIKIAKDTNTDGKTEDSKKTLADAINKAEEVRDSNTASEQDVLDAINNLQKAIEGLEDLILPEPEPEPEPEVPMPEPEPDKPNPTPNPKPDKPENPENIKKEVKRIAGRDRFETAVEVSRKHFKTADTVIIARSDIYPDALTASMLSKVKKAPILLTPSDKLQALVKEEIQRLGAKNVIIVGGDMAISKEIEESLNSYEIQRLAGKDRYETSAIIARKLAKENNIRNRAIIASGEVWADALAAGSFAGKENHPILLVKKDSIPEPVDKAIKDLEIKGVYIVGGSARISQKVKSQLPSIIKEFAGKNRYETASLLAGYGFATSKSAYLASGESFADSLIIGGVAGLEKAPILLSGHKALVRETEAYLDNSSINKINIIGGSTRISQEIEDILR